MVRKKQRVADSALDRPSALNECVSEGRAQLKWTRNPAVRAQAGRQDGRRLLSAGVPTLSHTLANRSSATSAASQAAARSGTRLLKTLGHTAHDLTATPAAVRPNFRTETTLSAGSYHVGWNVWPLRRPLSGRSQRDSSPRDLPAAAADPTASLALMRPNFDGI